MNKRGGGDYLVLTSKNLEEPSFKGYVVSKLSDSNLLTDYENRLLKTRTHLDELN